MPTLLFGLVAAGLSASLSAMAADLTTITTAPQPTLMARQASSSATTYETTSPLPLTDYFYPYSAIPYQVNPYAVGRGPQSGYNQCNSSTEGADSQCQTAIVNSVDDFCFWGAPGLFPNQSISDVEAAVVAYCTKSGHGSRIFPPGTFTGVQFMRTAAYIQVVGWFNQTAINLDPTDPGGELDPHGADLAGNPLGGLMYSTGLPSGDNTTYQQTESWNNFVGSNQFCIKLCDPNYSTDLNYCQNIYDLIGCNYNMPAAYEPGVFLSCEGDLQDEVGTYTSDGQTYTWSQPSSLPATSTLPWTPRIPASSNCVYYHSTDLFPAQDLGYQSTATVLDDIGLTTTPATTPTSYGTISQDFSGAASTAGAAASGGSASASASASRSGSGSSSHASGSTTASASAASKSSSAAGRSAGPSAILLMVPVAVFGGIATILF